MDFLLFQEYCLIKKKVKTKKYQHNLLNLRVVLGGVRRANYSDTTVAGYVFGVAKLPSRNFLSLVHMTVCHSSRVLTCPDAAAAAVL